MALQQDNSLQSKPEYVTFALFFIMFGLAVIAAVLNLMLLKFMTMNTEDENRDEIEAIEVILIYFEIFIRRYKINWWSNKGLHVVVFQITVLTFSW